jgi:hypothetical protein
VLVVRTHLLAVLALLVGVVACARGNYTLDVAVSGDGTTSPTAGSHSYPQGSIVKVTATPAQGATFTGWSGAASGTSRTVTVEMSANRSLRAVFGGPPVDGSSSGGGTSSYVLALTVAGNGTTDPAAGAHSYPAGTQLTLTATPAGGATFRGWSGSVTSTDTRITLVMSENRFLTASFAGGPSSSSGGSSGSRSSGAGSSSSGASTPGSSGSASSSSSSGVGGAGGACDAGTSSTAWATSCPAAAQPCTAGTWVAGGPDPDHAGFRLLAESAHFAVYSDESPPGAQAAVDHLEKVWATYFGSPIFLREPLCSSSTKAKVSIHVHGDWGLTGGAWASGRMGMWIGTAGLSDRWGLAHEFMHGVQASLGGMSCDGGANTCGWIHESDANWHPQQLDEFHQSELHCSEMLVNAPHLYLGSTRDRYCNWQFLEFLKDKYCFSAANAIWTGSPTADPFTAIMNGMKWSLAQLNDFFGEWAMHNVTWDYQDPPPQKTAGTNQGGLYRSRYGSITDTSSPERRLRLTTLEPQGDAWATSRRFQSPYHWAPQRWGYNVVRLVPDAGATSVTVTFRGVLQEANANADFRWGLVATDAAITRPRYSAVQRGTDGQLTFCVNGGEALFLVVMGAPSAMQQIAWDQPYSTIYRYPYVIQLANAWPEGFEGGEPAGCPPGTTRVANGGGCGPSTLPSSVYVGPYARVLGGTVSGTARIEDHATVVNGKVSSGRIGAMSIIGTQGPGGGNGFDVATSGEIRTTFYPLGYFESGQGLSGSASLVGDVEYRGQGTRRSSGVCSGFVDASTCVNGAEVTPPPPYSWRN